MIEKELGLLISALLTNAELQGVGPAVDVLKDYPLVVNPDKTVTVSPSDLAKNRKWVVWETFRTYNSAVEQAVMDDKDWQNPMPTGQGTISQAAGAIAGVATPLAGILGGPAGAAIAAALPGILQEVQGLVTAGKAPAGVPSLPQATGS